MSKSLNEVKLIGHITADIEVRFAASGTAIVNVGVATNYSNKKGEEITEYSRCVFFNKLAEICGEFLHKGDRVYVSGHLQTRKWTDKNDIERYSTEVICNDMIMLGSPKAGGQGESRPQSKPEPSGNTKDDFHDDVPF